jgi:hypothetical protein
VPKHQVGSAHSEKTKMKVVATYVATGSNSITAQMCKIPLKTLEHWKTQKWFNDQVQELKNSRNTQMSGDLKKVFDKAVAQLEERVDNGDFVWDQKTGKVIRVPVGSRNLNQIAKDSLDRQVLLDKVTTAPKEEHLDINQRLTELLQEFKRIGRSGAYQREGDIIDVETTDEPAPELIPEIPEQASGSAESGPSYPGSPDPGSSSHSPD